MEGRPSYDGKVFLKLYLYGYFNGIRSSRKLERECGRNIEVRWLLGGLVPNYHTIADFRKDNPKALKNCFKLYVLFLKEAGLIGGKTVAVDGSKFRASNSKKNNFSQSKIDRHLSYIEQKTEEYLQQLDQADAKELKGYHNGREIQQCRQDGIQTIVAPNETVNEFMNSIEKSIIAVNKPTSLLYLARLRTKRELWAGSSGQCQIGNVKT